MQSHGGLDVKRLLARVAILLACVSVGALAHADTGTRYPDKTITLVVPFPPGGVVDIVGRIVAERLGGALGGTVIVKNMAGAGGTIGASHVAGAAPDGYTLMLGGAATQVFGPALYKGLSYDPVKSFEPIVQISAEPLVLVVSQKLPVTTYQDLLSYMKAQGNAVNFASNGPGTFPHLCAELWKQSAGVKATHIPYPGGAQAVVALLGGDATFSINHMPVVLAQIRAGRLKALATTGVNRSPLFPDVPTFREMGAGEVQASAWWGLYAPAGTPRAIVEKLNAAMNGILAKPEVRMKFLEMGDEVAGGSPGELASYQESELAKWPKVIRSTGVNVK